MRQRFDYFVTVSESWLKFEAISLKFIKTKNLQQRTCETPEITLFKTIVENVKNTKRATTAQANHCRFVIDPTFDVRVHFDKLVTPSVDCKPAGILNDRRWNCTLKRFICYSPSDGHMDGSNWKVCCRRRQRFHCRNGISSHPFIIFLSNREQIRAGVNLYSIAGKQRMNMCKKLLKSLQNIRMQQKYEIRIYV